MTTLPLSEVFGPTLQGEGPFMGRPVSFVRLGLCNLSCSWCDTPYTWDRTRYDVDAECPETDVDKIHDRLANTGTLRVVLSGGEPLMHHQRLPDLLVPPWEWHAETNGTIKPPSWWLDRVEHTSISPKVITDDPERKRIKWAALHLWNEVAEEGRACFKFVVEWPDQLPLVDDVVETLGIRPEHVWIMPEGRTTGEVLIRQRRIVDDTLARGYNFSTRLHTLLWSDERGH